MALSELVNYLQQGAEIAAHGFGVTKTNSKMSVELEARSEIYDLKLVYLTM